MKNNGITLERNITDMLNGKNINSLPAFWKENIKKIFNTNDEGIIFARHVGGKAKYDVELVFNNKKIRISIKSGTENSIHMEDVYEFGKFLKELGVSKTSLKTILRYHFGDGTLNGTGNNKKNSNELKILMKNELKSFNREVNKKEMLMVN